MSDLQRETSDAGRAVADVGEPVRMCIIVAAGSSIETFYRGWIGYLRRNGFVITVVCASSESDAVIRELGVTLHNVEIPRAITPLADLRAIWRLFRFLRRERFDLVEVGFPKSALVGAVAAWMARVPVLVHILHGLAYERRGPLARVLLFAAALVPCRLAQRTIAVSASVGKAACADGLCDPETITVLGHGSYGGVDMQRFSPAARGRGVEVRARHGIARDAIVVGFVGRLSREKGIVELLEAFRELCRMRADLVLLLVGDYEHKQRPPVELIEFVADSPHVRHVGWQTDPLPFYGAMDMVVLPSHREGLGFALPEAAAVGLPTIASDIVGCRDAMCPNLTGLAVPVRDVPALGAAIVRLADDAELRRRLGESGRAWVTERFEQSRVWRLYLEEYRRLVRDRR